MLAAAVAQEDGENGISEWGVADDSLLLDSATLTAGDLPESSEKMLAVPAQLFEGQAEAMGRELRSANLTLGPRKLGASTVCGTANEWGSAYISCGGTARISFVQFASYGTPFGEWEPEDFFAARLVSSSRHFWECAGLVEERKMGLTGGAVCLHCREGASSSQTRCTSLRISWCPLLC